MTAPLTVFRSDDWIGISGAGTQLFTNAPADDPLVGRSCALVRDGAEFHHLVAAYTARTDLAYALVGVVGEVTQIVVHGPVHVEVTTTGPAQVFAGDGGDWSGYVVTDPIIGVTLGSASASRMSPGGIRRTEPMAPAPQIPAATPVRWVHKPPAVAEPPPQAPTGPAPQPYENRPVWPAVAGPPPPARQPYENRPALPAVAESPTRPAPQPQENRPAPQPQGKLAEAPRSAQTFDAERARAELRGANPTGSAPERAELSDAAPPQAQLRETAPPHAEPSDAEPPHDKPSDAEPPHDKLNNVEPPHAEPGNVEPAHAKLNNAEPAHAKPNDDDWASTASNDEERAGVVRPAAASPHTGSIDEMSHVELSLPGPDWTDPPDAIRDDSQTEPSAAGPDPADSPGGYDGEVPVASPGWSSQLTSVLPVIPTRAVPDAAMSESTDPISPISGPHAPAEKSALSPSPHHGAGGLISDVSWAEDPAPARPVSPSPAPPRALNDLSWASEQPIPATVDHGPVTPPAPVLPAPQPFPPPIVPGPSEPEPHFGLPAVPDDHLRIGRDVGTGQLGSRDDRWPASAAPPSSRQPDEPFGVGTTRPQDLDITIWRPIAESSVMTGGGLTVSAIRCVDGHLNPLIATSCRVCARSVPPQNSIIVPRPPLGLLRMSTSDTIRLDHGVIFGRDPGTPDAHRRDQPYFVKLADKDISRRHLEVVLDGWDVLVVDLNSSNGSAITMPGGAPEVIPGGGRAQLLPGTIVHLSDTISFVYEVTE